LHAQQAGITVIMDRCIFRDYTQLCQPWAQARIIPPHQLKIFNDDS
jgi:hypothetical protein